MSESEEIGVGVEALVETFRRMGLMWRLLPATVFAADTNTPSSTKITIDGDTEPTRAISMVGQVPQGARVFVMVVPPQGNYIVGIGTGGMRIWKSQLTQADAVLNLTTIPTVVSGTSQTIVVPPGATFEADIAVDFEKFGANTATVGVAQLYVDGVASGTQQALFRSPEATIGMRLTPGQNYGPTAIAAGSHVFAIYGLRAGGADSTVRINAVHTTLRVRIST